MRWVKVLAVVTVLFGAFCSTAPAGAIEQELYPGEKELHEAALKEGALYSYDTGPTWANWQGLFDAFKEGMGSRLRGTTSEAVPRLCASKRRRIIRRQIRPTTSCLLEPR